MFTIYWIALTAFWGVGLLIWNRSYRKSTEGGRY